MAGFHRYPHFLKEGGKSARRGNFLPFAKALKVVRKLKLTGQDEWKEWCRTGQRPDNIPASPDRYTLPAPHNISPV